MIVEQLEIKEPAKTITVKLPVDSYALEFVQQSGILFLWYVDSGASLEQNYTFYLVPKNDPLPAKAVYMGKSVKVDIPGTKGAYKQCFQDFNNTFFLGSKREVK